SQPQPGVVRALGRRGGIALAPVTATPGLVRWAASLLADAGLHTRVCADYRGIAWSKLVLKLLGNAVPAIVDLPPRRVLADLALCRLEVAAVREALAVMRALAVAPVRLPGLPVPALAWGLERLPLSILHRLLPHVVSSGRAGEATSLQADLEVGRRESEVEYLNGAVVRAGLALGVAVPANALIYRTLAAMVEGTIPRDAYARNPHGLLAPTR
ncbi:MAG: ketopantoate reductase C-terminal domain-containing protein, partial [Anaerolineae bacterium]|nr:ketopantoate reductase C-terminal domain-containing protein [Anaerolineae bacterium]